MEANGSAEDSGAEDLTALTAQLCLWNLGRDKYQGSEVSSQMERQVCIRNIQNSLWSKTVWLFVCCPQVLICSSMSPPAWSWRTSRQRAKRAKGPKQTDPPVSYVRRLPSSEYCSTEFRSQVGRDLLDRWLLVCKHNQDIFLGAAGLYQRPWATTDWESNTGISVKLSADTRHFHNDCISHLLHFRGPAI